MRSKSQMPTKPRISADPAMALVRNVAPPDPVQRGEEGADGSDEPHEMLALPEPLRREERHRRAHHRPAVGHEGGQSQRGDHGRDGRPPGPPAPRGRERHDENGQDDGDAGVPGQPGHAGTERRRDPVAPRQGEEAAGGRGQEEPLGVGEGQDVRGRAEDVEQDGAVGQPGAEDLPHGQPDGERRGQPEDECRQRPPRRGRLSRVTSDRARTAAGKPGKKAQRLPWPSW